MHNFLAPMLFILLYSCDDHDGMNNFEISKKPKPITDTVRYSSTDTLSWKWFLQHLPVVKAPVLDYRGQLVPDQWKHTEVVNYDVGTADLQQCADALMRLRAEYLFSIKKYDEIGFHFTDGQYYSWASYCAGVRPVVHGNQLHLARLFAPCTYSHEHLRKYLDIVYAYAGTISLEKELKKAENFEIGTIVIHGGSPGHCFIIVDEAYTSSGEKLFKLAEGYSPAQSIYILRNPWADGISPWYHLKKGTIQTASYSFSTYELKKFETPGP